MSTDQTVACQWCNGVDTYESGHSPMCVETQYKCRECGEETWEVVK
jgi:DNA-directed RNA polymerase subunit RPC12/RpoP